MSTFHFSLLYKLIAVDSMLSAIIVHVTAKGVRQYISMEYDFHGNPKRILYITGQTNVHRLDLSIFDPGC